jgi:nitrite reductase/ring-hydroxylating ferredoxin subunit
MTSQSNGTQRFPFPPFPESWYAIAWSNEVPKGSSVPLSACGQDLVAFRSADGVVHVLDAHCPHLGSHLGYGGKVVHDELHCPFHGWRFAGDGRCTVAPHAGSAPKCKPVRSWTTREIHDRIWIWFSRTDAPPAWSLPATLLDPDLRWAGAGRLNRTFPSHPQDILENAVDPLHFRFIHGMTDVFDVKTLYDEHCITTRLRARTASGRFGLGGFTLTGTITVRVYGMGLQTIHTVMSVDKLGLETTTLVVEGLTPREAGTASLLIDVHMADRLPPGAGWLARRAFYKAVVFDVDADVQVWANRRYLSQPRLTSADGDIGRYRRWARRFYPDASKPQSPPG